MLLVIIANNKFKFYRRNLKKEEIIEANNFEELKEFSKRVYLKITLQFEARSKISKSISMDDNLINIIGVPFRESQSIKINNISYSLYMYLARISRLFIEENIFIADKSNDYYLECFNIQNLKVKFAIKD